MKDLRDSVAQELYVHLHRLERNIREASRHVDDDSRALGMMDAADMIRAARTVDAISSAGGIPSPTATKAEETP